MVSLLSAGDRSPESIQKSETEQEDATHGKSGKTFQKLIPPPTHTRYCSYCKRVLDVGDVESCRFVLGSSRQLDLRASYPVFKRWSPGWPLNPLSFSAP